MSDDWMKAMGGQDESYRGIWSRQNVVSMLTLDTLIKHFGMPQFIKVAVGGFEEKVLFGAVRPTSTDFFRIHGRRFSLPQCAAWTCRFFKRIRCSILHTTQIGDIRCGLKMRPGLRKRT